MAPPGRGQAPAQLGGQPDEPARRETQGGAEDDNDYYRRLHDPAGADAYAKAWAAGLPHATAREGASQWRFYQDYHPFAADLMLPAVRGVQEDRLADAAEKRAAEALLDGHGIDLPEMDEDGPPGEDQIEIDATATMSHEERLKTLDFEQMSLAEVAEAMDLSVHATESLLARARRRMRTQEVRDAGS